MVKELRGFHSSDESFRKFVKVAIAEELVFPGSRKETLNALTEPYLPKHVKSFFEFLQAHVTLASNGMGVNIRESRAELSSLMSELGWDYPVYAPLVSAFEDALLDSHFKMREESK